MFSLPPTLSAGRKYHLSHDSGRWCSKCARIRRLSIDKLIRNCVAFSIARCSAPEGVAPGSREYAVFNIYSDLQRRAAP